MECALCHKKETGKTACKKGHYVCNDCHIRGMDSIIGLCLAETSKNPIEIIQKLMALPLCHMHGPEHHVMVGSALFTAYKNASGKLDLHKALLEMQSRGKQVPAELAVFGVLAVQESVQVCKHVRLHDLRHTFATMAPENGMDVKTLSATIGPCLGGDHA